MATARTKIPKTWREVEIVGVGKKAMPLARGGEPTMAGRSLIRELRNRLGWAMWHLNESELVHEMRRKMEVDKKWTSVELFDLAEGVKELSQVATQVYNGINRFDRFKLKPGIKSNLAGARDGIATTLTYFQSLWPENLRDFVDEHVGDDPELPRWRVEQMLFFTYCPIGMELGAPLAPSPRELAALREMTPQERQIRKYDIQQLKTVERVARNLHLFGMAADAQRARRDLEWAVSRKESVTVAMEGGCYMNGMRLLRMAWTALFWTTQVKDGKRRRLNKSDSDYWHSHKQEYGEPPETLVEQFQGMADVDGQVVYVYDSDGEQLYSAMPKQFAGEDPESLKERAALRQSKKARQQWNYRWENAVPGTAQELGRQLTAAERKRVTAFLKRNQRTSAGTKRAGFSIAEISALTNIDVLPVGQREFREAAHAQFTRNPDDTAEMVKDIGMYEAVWSMNLE